MINNLKPFCRHIVSNKHFDIILNGLTVFMVSLFIVSTEIKSFDYNIWYVMVEVIFFFGFLFEYIVRLIASDHMGRKILRPFMIIDIIVLVSFLLPHKLVVLRFFRILKLITLLKNKRYKHALYAIIRVCKNQKDSLIIVCVFFNVLIIISASLMCLAESESQPEFSSILKSIWWSVITSTSVGYGDLVPITSIGKIIASFTAVFGILIFSMLTAIFANGFDKELKKTAELHNKISTSPTSK